MSGLRCDTLFYQGNGSSQTQVVKYTAKKVLASTGETMWCTGCKGLKPLDVIYYPIIGEEVSDIILRPLRNPLMYLWPPNLIAFLITHWKNRSYGLKVETPIDARTVHKSVGSHAPVLSQVSLGQVTDMDSHRRKYDHWKAQTVRSENLILYGVSRGTAASFNAFTKEQYPEVKLVILEGAIDSIPNVIARRARNMLGDNAVAAWSASLVNSAISFFTQYKPEGPSPLDALKDFPKNVPVVFITSKIDREVPRENTYNIATALASRGDNPVYLLELEDANHPEYMFSNKADRDNYEHLIHAVYRRYGLQHNKNYAEAGKVLAQSCLISENPNACSTPRPAV